MQGKDIDLLLTAYNMNNITAFPFADGAEHAAFLPARCQTFVEWTQT